MMNRAISDQTLIYKIQTFHDRDAYASLYQKYISDIYRFIAFKVPTVQDAEELTSDVFLKVWSHLTTDGSTPVRGFRAFLYQTARNTIIDWYRKKSTSAEQPTEMHTLQIHDTAVDIAAETDSNLQVATLLAHMDTLKSEYKEVLILKYIEELSTSEIAKILKKNQTAVRVTLHRATKALQDKLNLS
jgi:RNA polymerase sigma-70 factor (ECF subfamily)